MMKHDSAVTAGGPDTALHRQQTCNSATTARRHTPFVLRAIVIGAGLSLSGCSSGSSFNPLTWWHGLQGGAIADQRPPPPGADQPYPNLATVPGKPQRPDLVEQQKIAQGLIADRANAHYDAAQNPVPDPSSAKASPQLFGGAVPPPGPPAGTGATDQNTVSASLAAASGPTSPAPAQEAGPTPAGAPIAKPAPVRPVKEAPLAPPGPQAAAGSQAAAPNLSANPPPVPDIPGVPVPRTGATPPPKAPPTPTTPQTLAESARQPHPVAFKPGSAVLTQAATSILAGIAHARGAHDVVVTGYGEAAASDPGAQSGAMKLALERARAMAAALTGMAVPGSAIRMQAYPEGNGGSARLVN